MTLIIEEGLVMDSLQSNELKGKAKKLGLSIYSIAKDLDDARLIISYLDKDPLILRDIWKNTAETHRRNCSNCGQPYRVARANAPKEGFCTSCDSAFYRKELMRVQKQNRRAERMGKVASLTFRQWIKTVVKFGGKCAYCQRAEMHDMEHFVPLKACGVGRGTSVNNVVPACSACNYYKKSRNPYNERSARRIRIPKSDLDRVRSYLSSEVAL